MRAGGEWLVHGRCLLDILHRDAVDGLEVTRLLLSVLAGDGRVAANIYALAVLADVADEFGVLLRALWPNVGDVDAGDGRDDVLLHLRRLVCIFELSSEVRHLFMRLVPEVSIFFAVIKLWLARFMIGLLHSARVKVGSIIERGELRLRYVHGRILGLQL